MSTTRPLTPLGSTRSSAGSDSLLNRPSAAEASKASRTSSLKSTASPKTTTNTANHSHGPPPQIPSSKNSPDYVIVFPGQHTRFGCNRLLHMGIDPKGDHTVGCGHWTGDQRCLPDYPVGARAQAGRVDCDQATCALDCASGHLPVIVHRNDIRLRHRMADDLKLVPGV